MATTRLTKTFSGNGDRQKFTLSMWIKRSSTSQNFIFTSGSYNSTSMNQMYFDNSGILAMYTYNSSGSVLSNIETNRVFRDTSAWYHIVLRVDTTQSTAADRVRLYVNGIHETSLASTTYPSQNANYLYSESITAQYFGQRADAGNSSSFDGSMSHIHMCDGYSYDASSFGETDTTTGEWKIKTSLSVSYGTNGYWILKDGNSLTDASPNSNNFAVGAGTLTNSEDCPSNVFATLNPLNVQSTGYTIANGNLSITANSGNAWRTMYATLGASSGKYYWEQKITNFTGSNPHYIGISDIDNMKNANDVDFENVSTEAFGYTKTGQSISKNSLSSYGDSWTTGDIIGVAVDLDNLKIYFSKNGVFQNSSNPANGTNPAYTITSGKTYTATTSTYYSDNQYQMNFGNGFFGTTAISSEGSNASGIGKFEYDVPAGYTALSTKGLNE